MAKNYHVQLNKQDGNGTADKVFPINTAADVKVEGFTNIPSDISTLQDLVGKLGALAFDKTVSIPDVSESTKGLVKISNETNDMTATSTAATTAAVSEVNNATVKTSGAQVVSGVKNFTDGITIGGNAKLTTEVTSENNKVMTLDFI